GEESDLGIGWLTARGWLSPGDSHRRNGVSVDAIVVEVRVVIDKVLASITEIVVSAEGGLGAAADPDRRNTVVGQPNGAGAAVVTQIFSNALAAIIRVDVDRDLIRAWAAAGLPAARRSTAAYAIRLRRGGNHNLWRTLGAEAKVPRTIW